MKRESAAFFWFDRKATPDADHPSYRRYVYERFLPELAPGKQRSESVWFVLFNGMCIGVYSGRVLDGVIDSGWGKYFREADTKLLVKVREVGKTVGEAPYVIAVIGQGTRRWQEVDRALHGSSTLGYLGMSLPRSFNRDNFVTACKAMWLDLALRIDGGTLKDCSDRVSYDTLNQFGFKAGDWRPWWPMPLSIEFCDANWRSSGRKKYSEPNHKKRAEFFGDPVPTNTPFPDGPDLASYLDWQASLFEESHPRGLLVKLFGQSVDANAAESALVSGCNKLWNRKAKEAQALFKVAARGHARPALPLAYLSLAERMQGKYHLRQALKVGLQATKKDRTCFEGLAALSVAMLTANDLVNAIERWQATWSMEPFNTEGHHLRLVLYILFIETSMNATVTDDDIRFVFNPEIPLARGAIRLLDGYPELASVEFPRYNEARLAHPRNLPYAILRALGLGLTSWRNSESEYCRRKKHNKSFSETDEYLSAVENLELTRNRIGDLPRHRELRLKDSIEALLAHLENQKRARQ